MCGLLVQEAGATYLAETGQLLFPPKRRSKNLDLPATGPGDPPDVEVLPPWGLKQANAKSSGKRSPLGCILIALALFLVAVVLAAVLGGLAVYLS